jgi:hypothetical protein
VHAQAIDGVALHELWREAHNEHERPAGDRSVRAALEQLVPEGSTKVGARLRFFGKLRHFVRDADRPNPPPPPPHPGQPPPPARPAPPPSAPPPPV